MLRNVALTAPYGHNGAFPTLQGIVRHHLDPLKSFDRWKREMAALPAAPWLEDIDFMVWQDSREIARQRAAITLKPRAMAEEDQAAVIAFLNALTGRESVIGRLGIPMQVPSGLPVDIK